MRTESPAALPSDRQRQVHAADTVAAAAERRCFQNVDLAQKVGDERRRRTLVHLAGRADLLDDAVIHHDDAIGHRQRLFLIVRHHDRRHAQPSLQLPDLAAQPLAYLRVER